MSYSFDRRQDMHNRAFEVSELSGTDNRPLQCSHNNHDKHSPEYNNNDFGLLVTDIEHYAYHLIFRHSPYVEEVLGLNYLQNQWSLDKMWQDIMRISRSLGMAKEDVLKEVARAKLYWYAQLAIDPIES